MDDAVLEGDFAVRDSQWLEQVGISSGLDLRAHFDLVQGGGLRYSKSRILTRRQKGSEAITK